jgi:hypothetical protein
MKHAQRCLPEPDESVSSANKYIQSVNPLLSLTDDKHSPNLDYTNCDLYNNLSSVDRSNISNGDDSNIINGDDSSLTDHNINCDTDSFSIIEDDEFNGIRNAILQQMTAVIIFQVMLHEIIMKHKASLCMYNDISHLVTEYTSSSSFNRYGKLKSQKSFLRSMQETHSTHGLHPKKSM